MIKWRHDTFRKKSDRFKTRLQGWWDQGIYLVICHDKMKTWHVSKKSDWFKTRLQGFVLIWPSYAHKNATSRPFGFKFLIDFNAIRNDQKIWNKVTFHFLVRSHHHFFFFLFFFYSLRPNKKMAIVNHRTDCCVMLFFLILLLLLLPQLLVIPVDWDCRIHRLHLCRRVNVPQQTSDLDMTLNNLMVRLQ